VKGTKERLDSTELKINNTKARMPTKDDQKKGVNPGRGGQKPQQQAKPIAQKAKFEGRCKELEGHVYDICGSQQANQFMKTTEEIGLYVGKTYSHGGDIATAVRTYAKPVFETLEDPPDDAPIATKKRWELQLKRLNDQEDKLEENIAKLYSLVWGQCSDGLRAKIESLKEFAEIRDYMEGIELLKLIKTLAFKFEPQIYTPLAVDNAIHKFVSAKQGKHMTAAEYLEHFQNNVKVLEAVGASLGPHRSVIAMVVGGGNPDEATEEQIAEANE
jgi:hypothetical protein